MTKINSVYIIDDDPIVVFGIKKMLNNQELCKEIQTFVNGKVALEHIQIHKNRQDELPDVIFLDLNMPIMDGWQFLEEFLNLDLPKTIRINIVTSSIDPYDFERWEVFKKRSSHPIDFKSKPITPNDIKEITKVA